MRADEWLRVPLLPLSTTSTLDLLLCFPLGRRVEACARDALEVPAEHVQPRAWIVAKQSTHHEQPDLTTIIFLDDAIEYIIDDNCGDTDDAGITASTSHSFSNEYKNTLSILPTFWRKKLRPSV